MDMNDVCLNVCRLCAEATTPQTCIPLYNEDKHERIVTKQINQLVTNLISPDDGLPQEICLKCSKNVELCYSFLSGVIATQNKLKRLIYASEQKTKLDPNKNQFDENSRGFEEITCDALRKEYAAVKNEDCQIEREQVDNVDDFIEFFVVHPEEMDEMDVNVMLDTSQNFVSETKNTITSVGQTTSIEPPSWKYKYSQMQKGENDHNAEMMAEMPPKKKMRTDTDDYDTFNHDTDKVIDRYSDDDLIIKEEPKEVIYSHDYDVDKEIIELPEQHTNWVYDKETNEESDIVYKCASCSNTFKTEALFQSHNCRQETENVNDTADGKNFFHCELCDRVFKSKFVFKLHCSQHKKSTLCQLCNACFLDSEDLLAHLNQVHPYSNLDDNTYEEISVSSEKQCDICGKITENLKQHKMYHTIKELEICKAENKKFLKKWFYCQKCNKKIFSEANFLFHVAKHNGEETVSCRQCDFVAVNIQDYNMHITTHTGGKYFICNHCDKCFFTRSAISDHVLIHMEGTRYMCEICGKRFKTSRSNAQHKLLQHKKYFRCNRCNRGFTHEAKLKSHYNICRVINQDQKESKVFEPVEKFFCNICNSNIKSSSEISILFHKAKHEGKDGVECKFCNLLCKNACMYKNHLLIHTNQRPYACTQCPKSFRTKGCLVQHMLVHGDEYKYTCEYCGKKSKKLTTHVNHVNIHTDTKPYKCPDCDRPFRQLSDMKKHRRTHLKNKTETVTVNELPYLTIKTEVEDMIAAESIQQLQLA